VVRNWPCSEDLRRRLTWTGSVVGALLVLTFAADSYADDTSAKIVFTKNVTISDLPAGIEQRLPPGISNDALHELLRRQPSIVIDGATLAISAPARGSNRTLMLNRLELLHGGKIVTNGVNLEIDAELFVSDGGEFVSFDPANDTTSAPTGSNGASGLNAGALVLDGTLNRNDILRVSLVGQDGQAGGPGFTGSTGAPGTRGDNGADHLFDCAHGGGNGGNGSQGAKGGQGGAGGAGGNGGRLILRGGIATQRVQIEFTSDPGKGGMGGPGGSGGPGGPGGPGGSGTTYCRGGNPGQSGPAGPKGEKGAEGPPGQPGGIFAD
jgi:hypothetical protein